METLRKTSTAINRGAAASTLMLLAIILAPLGIADEVRRTMDSGSAAACGACHSRVYVDIYTALSDDTSGEVVEIRPRPGKR